jgi:hypothetical protein
LNNTILVSKDAQSISVHFFLRRSHLYNIVVKKVILVNAPFYFHAASTREQIEVFETCSKYNGSLTLFVNNSLQTSIQLYTRYILSNECETGCTVLQENDMIDTNNALSFPSYDETTKFSLLRSYRPSFTFPQFNYARSFLQSVETNLPYPIEYSYILTLQEFECDMEMYDIWNRNGIATEDYTTMGMITQKMDDEIVYRACEFKIYQQFWNVHTSTLLTTSNVESVSVCCLTCTSTLLCKVFTYVSNECKLYSQASIKYEKTNLTIGGHPEIVNLQTRLVNYVQTSKKCIGDTIGTFEDAQRICDLSDTCKGIQCEDCGNCNRYITCNELETTHLGCALERTSIPSSIPWWVWTIVTLSSIFTIVACCFFCRYLNQLGKEQTSRQPSKYSGNSQRLQSKMFSRRAKIYQDSGQRLKTYNRYQRANPEYRGEDLQALSKRVDIALRRGKSTRDQLIQAFNSRRP